ncbi:uncharacterized protein LOC116134458 [Pistacia vera]|uniref:uncharacterized protein LOC116134458 n=1 Tax=Pistacia vera TaxID=55513 RepID=UPI0012639FE4|nr:uncharacterized protein LOC116134458 [Pistacia vera]
MAGSSAFSDVHPPVRSISLPSRIHPTSVKLESTLNHLKAWQISSTTAPADTIQNGLVGLAELFNCIEEFIHSPQTQQALLRHRDGKLVEEALDGSVTLLDTCGTARDILLTMKEHVQTLQSALRRRGGDSSIESHIAAYISFKKKGKKDFAKCLSALKKLECKGSISSSVLEADHHLSFIIKVLQETSAISISIFRALLIFLSTPTMKTKLAGWSLISKLVSMKLLSSDQKEQKIINEVESVDVALYSLQRTSNAKKNEVQMAQRLLEILNVSIEGFEGGLDSMFRCLVQNRVSFLNILAH